MAQLDAWPWSMAVLKQRCVVVGCVDGSLACYQLMLNTIHALHKDRYAFRENQTDVVIQQLQKQKSTRIRCNDLVRKVAIYNNRLAIQLSDRVLIYRQLTGDKEGESLEYKLMDKINQNFECSLLVITSQHLILCHDRRLTCYDLKGIKQREWIMESLIRYIKVVGGPIGRETILVGMRFGLVCKIFVDNPFPVEVVRLKSMIRCVDISLSKRKLATVDEEGICVIYDTEKKEIINQEPNMASVAFNSANEDLVCYSGQGVLNIKSHWFTPYQQRLEPSQQGFVVGFMGKCVYILHMYSMMLGSEALENMEFDVARKSFFRIRDCRSLLLVNELIEMKNRGSSINELKAHLYAHNKRFRDCVQLLQQMGAENVALEMFADLRMFEQAQLASVPELLMSSGDYDRAIRLMMANNWVEKVANAARKLDKSDANLLREIGQFMAKNGEYIQATSIFQRINDLRSIIQMHALALINRNSSLSNDVYLPYARWLAERDRFDEAQIAYNKAGHEKEASLVLEQLTKNAVKENRFKAASFYYRRMAEQLIEKDRGINGNNINGHSLLESLENCLNLADIYFAYEPVYKYVVEPFTEKSLDILFHAARFISLHKPTEYVSRVTVYYTLMKLSRHFGCYKTARQALNHLHKLRCPPQYQSQIDVATLEIRAMPFSDSEEFQPICGTANPILGGHECVHCNHYFIYSFITFEVLPLIQFQIDDDISDKEAVNFYY
ncbi:unnamed protein product [Meloidogyne enterolobii]|uniref:Uncharacterized protein n=1 Tax=Meloidogyne enterolobii TaxID=390850 RepID=A0ACB0YIX7_MELEN